MKALDDFAAKEGVPLIPICAKIEAELNDLSVTDRREFLEAMGQKESGLAPLSRHGDYDGGPWHPAAPRLILIAAKGAP